MRCFFQDRITIETHNIKIFCTLLKAGFIVCHWNLELVFKNDKLYIKKYILKVYLSNHDDVLCGIIKEMNHTHICVPLNYYFPENVLNSSFCFVIFLHHTLHLFWYSYGLFNLNIHLEK